MISPYRGDIMDVAGALFVNTNLRFIFYLFIYFLIMGAPGSMHEDT